MEGKLAYLLIKIFEECTFQELVRREREGMGLTQRQFSITSGIPYDTIVNIENGISNNPTLKTLIKIMKVIRKNKPVRVI